MLPSAAAIARHAIGLTVGFALAACGSAPVSIQAPASPPDVFVSYYHGTPLGGEANAFETRAAAQSLVPRVHCRWRWLARAELDRALAPLAAAAEVLANPGASAPVAVIPPATSHARVARGEAAQQLGGEDAAAIDVVLPWGATAEVALADAAPRRGRFGLLVAQRSDGALQVALFDDTPAPDPTPRNPALSGLVPTAPAGRDIALLSTDLAGQAPLAVALPGAARGERELVAIVELAPPLPSGDAAVAAARSALARSRDARDREPQGEVDADLASMRSAGVALTKATRRRAALLWLAERCSASLTADVALVADEAALQRVATVLGETALPGDPAPAGLALEKACLTALAQGLDDGTLTPELSSVLLRHAGAAARFATFLTEAAQRADSTQALDDALVQENTLLLGDHNPATRVRAHDWLAARGHAVPSFDPLASDDERHKALAVARGRR